MSASFAVLSLGGGVQSSTLIEMACDGLIGPLRAICFADTGGQLPETYAHLDCLRGRAEQSGIEFLAVSAGDLRAGLPCAAQLRILGSGAAPHQASRALRLLFVQRVDRLSRAA